MADFTHDSADDAFHEIQLSGKQLVFLFMATTVVSVVIFLCGVLVGRSVQAKGIVADHEVVPPSDPQQEAAVRTEPAVQPPAPATEEDLTYPRRLDSPEAVAEKLSPAEGSTSRRAEPAPAARPAPPATQPATPEGTSSKPASAAASRPVEPPLPPPAAQGARPGTWIVQVISLKDRTAAAQIVQRLKNKGYPSFLVTTSGPTQLYKVQVGRYRERSEAQKIQARLKREEQFDSLIVR